MKVYFSASRFYRENYEANYAEIIKVLEDYGCNVLDNSFRTLPKDGPVEEKEKVVMYNKMVKMIDSADFSVFEASYPSTIHIGHEITLAIDKGKPVIVLFLKGKEPMLFRGIKNQKIIWVSYELDTLSDLLIEAIEVANKIGDVRFNFFVSPKILNYLDWVAKEKMIPRSVFLRRLIENEMKKDKLFGHSN